MLPLLAAALLAVEAPAPLPVCVEIGAEAPGLDAGAIADALVVEQRKLGVELDVGFAEAGERCAAADPEAVALRVSGPDRATLEAPGQEPAEVPLEEVPPVDRAPLIARALVELAARRPLELGPLARAPDALAPVTEAPSQARKAPRRSPSVGPWAGLALLAGSHLAPAADDARVEISAGVSLLDEVLLLRACAALRPETSAGTERVPVDLAAVELGTMAHLRVPVDDVLLGIGVGGGVELVSVEAHPETRLTAISQDPRPGLVRLEVEAVFRSGPLRPRVGLGLRRYLSRTELTWLSEPVYAVPAWGAHVVIGLELLP